MPILDLIVKKQRLTKQNRHQDGFGDGLMDHGNELYHEQYFSEMLRVERKRSERSRKPFVLMLVDLQKLKEGLERHEIARKVVGAFSLLTRDTDLKGWYRYGNIIGVIFTEIDDDEKNLKSTQKHITDKYSRALKRVLHDIEYTKVLVTWHVFPGHTDRVSIMDPYMQRRAHEGQKAAVGDHSVSKDIRPEQDGGMTNNATP